MKRHTSHSIKNKTLLRDIKTAIEPYLFAWQDWSESEECGLTEIEIKIINAMILENLDLSVIKQAEFRSAEQSFEIIKTKLKSRYEDFQEWVIFMFLKCVIDLAKRQGSPQALDQRIETLSLPVEQIALLKKFRIHCIRDLGILYNEQDFKSKQLFDLITDFYRFR